MKRCSILLWVGAASCLMYGCAALRMHALTVMKVTDMTNALGQVRTRFREHEIEHGSAPSEGLDWLGLPSWMLVDPFSGQSFVRFSVWVEGKDTPVIGQPAAFRSGIWPFVKMSRYAAFFDGSIENVYDSMERRQ